MISKIMNSNIIYYVVGGFLLYNEIERYKVCDRLDKDNTHYIDLTYKISSENHDIRDKIRSYKQFITDKDLTKEYETYIQKKQQDETNPTTL